MECNIYMCPSVTTKQLLIFSVCQWWFSFLVFFFSDKPEAEIKDSRCLDAGQSRLVFVPVSNVSGKECLDCHCEESDRGLLLRGRRVIVGLHISLMSIESPCRMQLLQTCIERNKNSPPYPNLPPQTT